MSELQIPDYMINRPVSISDLAESAMRMQSERQQQRLNEMKMAEAEQLAPAKRQLYEAQAQDEQTNAMLRKQKVLSSLANNVISQLDKSGIKDSQQRQQFINQAIDAHKPYLQGVLGIPANEYWNEDQIRSLASSSSDGHNKFTVHPGTGLLVDLTTGTTQEIIDPATGKRVVDPRYNTDVQGNLGQIKALTDAYKDGRITRDQFESNLNRLQSGQIQQVESPRFKYQFNNDADIIAMADELKKQQAGQSSMPSVSDVSGIPSFQQVEKEKAGIKTEAAINEAVGKEQGKSEFEAQRDLPAVIDQANNALRLISELKTHPGKAGMVGMPNLSGALGGVRGSKEASFNTRLNQIKGQNFLQAFQNLKGAGQITEIEGQKATEAIARLDTAQEEKEFDQALDELSDIVKQGLNRAKTKAGSKEPAIKSDLDIHSEADAILRGSK